MTGMLLYTPPSTYMCLDFITQAFLLKDACHLVKLMLPCTTYTYPPGGLSDCFVSAYTLVRLQ